MTSVLIVDEDGDYRQTLQRELPHLTQPVPGILEGLAMAGSWQPSVIVIAARFGGSSTTGIDALPLFRAACPRAKAIVISDPFRAEEAARARQRGAVGYVGKYEFSTLRRMVVAARVLVKTAFVAPETHVLH